MPVPVSSGMARSLPTASPTASSTSRATSLTSPRGKPLPARILADMGVPVDRREQCRRLRPEAARTKPRSRISTRSWTSTSAPRSRWRTRCCPACVPQAGAPSFTSAASPITRRIPENAAYAASKFGLRGLHEVLVGRVPWHRGALSLVSPGPTDTACGTRSTPITRRTSPIAPACCVPPMSPRRYCSSPRAPRTFMLTGCAWVLHDLKT